jgi:hypothetical protein
MRKRNLVLAGAMAVAAAWLLPPPGVVAQTQASGVKAKTAPAKRPVPRTPDGRPDLQGIWNFATATPLERPAQFADKAFLTAEEAATYAKQVVAERSTDRRDGPTGADVNRAYNDFWIDWGSKVVGTRRTSIITDPEDGKLPPLTEAAQKRQAARAEAGRRPANGPEDRSLAERCMLGFNAGPPMLTGPYNNTVQLIQTRDYVAIVNEMVHNARIVPLDGRAHAPASVRQWSGDSRGRWEGDTLVIESRNFVTQGTANIMIRASSDENLHLIERFTRQDAYTLLYEFTVTDPSVWTKPWSGAITMTPSEGGMYEYACHEGNRGMEGILSAARADDKAASDAAPKK